MLGFLYLLHFDLDEWLNLRLLIIAQPLASGSC